MNELVSRYPTLASMVDVGTTIEGRTIRGIRITNDAITDKPGVVYFGCEHAREWITPTVPTYVATQLLEGYGSDPTVTELVDYVEFFLIPVFNVDGYIYSWTTERYWRKNRRNNGDGSYGVDLNRNWGEGWGGPGSSSSTGSQIYRGPTAFSEPETQALRDFFMAHPYIQAQLDIHSYGQLILWPYGYTSLLPSDQDTYDEIGSAMQSLIYQVHGENYDIGPVYTAIYPASGVSLDWTYAELDILSYSFECRDTGFYNFVLPADQIIPNNQEVLPAIVHLSDSDWVRLPCVTDAGGIDRNRFVSFSFNTECSMFASGGSQWAIRVRLTKMYDDAVCLPRSGDLPDLSAFEGQVRWVGEPHDFSQTVGVDETAVPPTFKAAELKCESDAYFGDWPSLLGDELLHLYGAALVPCSTYEIQLVDGSSCPDLADENCYSVPLTIHTGKWGDVVAPFHPGPPDQPDFLDIAAETDKFKGKTPPYKVEVVLQPNVPDLSVKVSFLDIARAADAFRGTAYAEDGPGACP